MITGILVLISAISLSVLAGYTSIIGMTALFPGGGIQIIALMGTLEVSKIFVTMWIHRHWNDKGVNFAHRSYLIFAVLSLMLLTSIGIFGFLSRSHLDQEAPMAGIGIQMEQLQQKIDQIKVARKNGDDRKAQLDQSLATVLKNSKKASDAKTAQKIVDSQRKDRDQLAADMASKDAAINDLSEQLAKLKLQSSEVTAKLGPIKYLATTFGISDPNFAVEVVIVLITLVFDPLAILLFLAAIISFEGDKENEPIRAFQEPEAIETHDINAIESNEINALEPLPNPHAEHEEAPLTSHAMHEVMAVTNDSLYEILSALRDLAPTKESKTNPSDLSISSPSIITREPTEPKGDIEPSGPHPFDFSITPPLAIATQAAPESPPEPYTMLDEEAVASPNETAPAPLSAAEEQKSVKEQLVDLFEHNPELLQSVIDTVRETESAPVNEIAPTLENHLPPPSPTAPESAWLSKPWF